MNKPSNIIKMLLVSSFALLLTINLYSTSPQNADIRKRIANLNTVIDVRMIDEVTDEVIKVVENRRRDAESILGRTTLYFPVIEQVLREKNLPEDLKYITVIESSLLPNARSHQGAAGIWQFMKGTGELYGLKMNKYVDERKDIYKSTEKALDYLKVLYDIYGNWTLALAAYNCGSGNINKAIAKAGGSTDYWVVRKYLPKETKRYIPKFIAAAYLMNYYYEHDLKAREPSSDLKYVASVKVFQKVDFNNLSKEFDLDIETIKFLNPMYNKDYIPATSSGDYTLTLPQEKLFAYVEKYNSYDNLVASYASIAAAVQSEAPVAITVDRTTFMINKLNKNKFALRDNLKNSSVISSIKSNKLLFSTELKLYRLKRKESLQDVARNNNITLDDLLVMNKLTSNDEVAPGSLIVLAK